MESGKLAETAEAHERLEAARGHLRDAIGSVRNLVQALHSVRVGPRSIGSVLPDVREACASIEPHAKTLLESVGASLGDRGAVDQLLAWMQPRAKELERALASAQARPVNARARLSLEQVAARVAGELEAARALVDLLDEAVRAGRVPIDLANLLRHPGATRDEGEKVDVRVASDLTGESRLSPRVISAVLGIGAGLVHASSKTTPSIRLSVTASGRALVIAADGAPGDVVSLPALPLVAPTLACATAAARACGARVVWEQSVPRFSVELPG